MAHGQADKSPPSLLRDTRRLATLQPIAWNRGFISIGFARLILRPVPATLSTQRNGGINLTPLSAVGNCPVPNFNIQPRSYRPLYYEASLNFYVYYYVASLRRNLRSPEDIVRTEPFPLQVATKARASLPSFSSFAPRSS